MIADPIADMLTRIRNANALRYEEVSMPNSKIKEGIAKILKEQGFITDYSIVKEGGFNSLSITLKNSATGDRVITGLRRISKPGLRVYCEADKLPKVLKGLGIAIVSTNKGLLTDNEARKAGIGGEILCFVW